MRFQRKVYTLLTNFKRPLSFCPSFFLFVMFVLYLCTAVAQCAAFSFSSTGSDGAASSYHVKQLEEQNGRLKEALVRWAKSSFWSEF